MAEANLFSGFDSNDLGMMKKIISDYVIKKADKNLVGKNVIPVEDVNALDIILSYPSGTELVAQKVGEYASADAQKITWNEIQGTLSKYQISVLISDEAKKRQIEDVATRRSVEAAARGLQRAEDNEIFSTLLSYVGAANTVTATAAWNTNTADIANDIASAIEVIFDNTNEDDFEQISICIPKKVFPFLLSRTVSNTDRRMLDFMEGFGIKFYKTSYLSTDALVVAKSEETAIHYRHVDSEGAEQARLPGVGDRYIINSYFKTFVIPDDTNINYRIVKIQGVAP